MHFALANPCESTICETLLKVYFLPAAPLLLASSRTSLLSLVILNVFTLFVITILTHSKHRLPFICLPQLLHYSDMPTNPRRNTVTQLFQEHKIVCNLPDLSCSHIFFSLKSFSRGAQNDRVSASLIPMSLNAFSISSQRAEGRLGRDHCPLKETWQQQANCPALTSKIKPASFTILQ